MRELDIKKIKELEQGKIYIVTVKNATEKGLIKLHDELFSLKTGNEFIIVPEGIKLDKLEDFLKSKGLLEKMNKSKKRWWKLW